MSGVQRLAGLYDADLRVSNARVAYLARTVLIPHPLHGVDYADGSLPDTTAGHVRCVGCRIGRPCRERRDR